jgi:hypothetical protein
MEQNQRKQKEVGRRDRDSSNIDAKNERRSKKGSKKVEKHEVEGKGKKATRKPNKRKKYLVFQLLLDLLEGGEVFVLGFALFLRHVGISAVKRKRKLRKSKAKQKQSNKSKVWVK